MTVGAWWLLEGGGREEEEFEDGAVMAIQVGDCEATISTGKNPTFRALVEVVVCLGIYQPSGHASKAGDAIGRDQSKWDWGRGEYSRLEICAGDDEVNSSRAAPGQLRQHGPSTGHFHKSTRVR